MVYLYLITQCLFLGIWRFIGLWPPDLMLLWPGHFSAGQGFAEYLGMWSGKRQPGSHFCWFGSHLKKGEYYRLVDRGYRICRYHEPWQNVNYKAKARVFPLLEEQNSIAMPVPPQNTHPFEKHPSNNIVTKWWFKYFSFQIRTWWNDPKTLFLHGLKSPPW